ncbi:hypothetical protein [Haloferax sp. Atlit-12N]|uniref:hypothetical protein n=1 Tax=Haloferax sp. Atlit-12N TaxID=2077203 RepID=UPI0018F4D39F|nr:hypothetical protein [Haloferax sp. Atlit-12N]
MSCGICGSPCQGRLCNECELIQRFEDEHDWLVEDLEDELDDEDDVDRGDGVATDGGNAEASLGAFETVAEALGISLDTLYRRLAHETPSNPREWEPPLPEAQEHAGAEEMHVNLNIEPTTAQGGVSAELSDRVNQLYVEATTENVIFEVAEEFQSVSFSTTFTPDQAKAIGCALIAGSKRAADANSGVIVRKYNLAGIDRGEGIETDGSGDENPLDDLLVDAQEQKEQFNEARERLQSVREKLKLFVQQLRDDGTLSEDDAEEIYGLISDGKYGDARGAISEALSKKELKFDDDEKDLFARHFSESWEEHVEAVEQVRTALLDFSRDLNREDLVDYLYGKHSGLNKGDIRAVFDAFDEVERTGLGVNRMARALTSYNRDLNIQPTEEVLKAIKEEAER